MTGEGPKYPDVEVQLSGTDGNAFAIMGRVSGALRVHLLNEAGMTRPEAEKEISAYSEESMSGDYDHLLRTALKWVTVL